MDGSEFIMGMAGIGLGFYTVMMIFKTVHKKIDAKAVSKNLEGQLHMLQTRFADFETRLINLETIIVEREKASKFDSLIN